MPFSRLHTTQLAALLCVALTACDADPPAEPALTPPAPVPSADPAPALSAGALAGAALPIARTPTWRAVLDGLPLSPWFDDPGGALALDAFEDRDYREAEAGFRVIAALSPTPERRRAARYMAALAHTFRDGEDARPLEQLYEEDSALRAYYAHFAGLNHLENRRLEPAIAWSARVPDDDPNSERAALTRVEALGRLGRSDEALALLRRDPLRSPELSDAHADLLRDAGRPLLAAWIDTLLVLTWPESREASRRIDAILPEIDDTRHRDALRQLDRGARHYRRHRYRRAVRSLRKASRALPERSPERCEALLLLARSYERRGRDDRADSTYAIAERDCALTPSHPLILFSAGRFHAEQGDAQRALQCFNDLYDAHPNASVCDDARLLEAELHADAGQVALARGALLAAAVAGDDQRERAAFDLLWSAYARDDLEEALELAALAREIPPDDDDARGRAHYWYARILQRLERDDAALVAYTDALAHAPLTYYGALSYARLAEAGGPEDAARRFAEVATSPVPTALNQRARFDPDWLKAGGALVRLGLDAAAERHFAHRLDDADVDWLLAALYQRSGQRWRSYRHARRNQRALFAHAPTPDTRHLWSLAFPRPFPEAVSAARRGLIVPEGFVYAVMRRESSFREGARSSAGARGLMQLMLPTAQAMYEEDEHSDRLTHDDLIQRPELNIRLGALYLHRQLSRYDHPAIAAAAYNAGGPSARRWLEARGHHDLDHFVETIPYDQTRRYTRAVLTYYAAYHALETGEPLLLDLSLR